MTKFGKHWLIWAKVWPIRAEFGKHTAEFGQQWPSLAEHGPKFGPSSATFDQCCPRSAMCWPNSPQIGKQMAHIGRDVPNSWKLLTNSGRLRPKFGQVWPESQLPEQLLGNCWTHCSATFWTTSKPAGIAWEGGNFPGRMALVRNFQETLQHLPKSASKRRGESQIQKSGRNNLSNRRSPQSFGPQTPEAETNHEAPTETPRNLCCGRASGPSSEGNSHRLALHVVPTFATRVATANTARGGSAAFAAKRHTTHPQPRKHTGERRARGRRPRVSPARRPRAAAPLQSASCGMRSEVMLPMSVGNIGVRCPSRMSD